MRISIHKNTEFFSPPRESGQILLVVVLLMVIILTIGLSLAARSITNIRQSTEEDNSQRAFAAAEAGIQVALQNKNDVGLTTFEDGTTYTATIKPVSANAYTVNNGRTLLKNESVDVWLASYPTYTPTLTSGVTVAWGNAAETDPCNHAALEIVVLSGTITAPTMQHLAYDPCSTRRVDNRFSQVSYTSPTTINGKDYRYTVPITVTNGLIMRIIPLYTNTILAVRTATGSLPVQGKVIEAVGTSGETQRKIVVVQSNPKLPIEMFPYVLFTPDNL